MTCRRTGQSSHHDPRPGRHHRESVPHEVTEATLDAVAVVRLADLLGHDETDGRDVRRFDWSTHVDDEVGLDALAAATNGLAEHLTVAHAVHARQHARAQAESLARPLRRRAARIE